VALGAGSITVCLLEAFVHVMKSVNRLPLFADAQSFTAIMVLTSTGLLAANFFALAIREAVDGFDAGAASPTQPPPATHAAIGF
jgi:hypothetical protein